jgi:hypothetical protein
MEHGSGGLDGFSRDQIRGIRPIRVCQEARRAPREAKAPTRRRTPKASPSVRGDETGLLVRRVCISAPVDGVAYGDHSTPLLLPDIDRGQMEVRCLGTVIHV